MQKSRYLQKLRADPEQFERLTKDLLINGTSFFRDREIVDFLADEIVPDLVAGHADDSPLRLWIAGCGSGEETYSLAMLVSEQIAAAGRDIKLEVLATDVDADAVARAREGLYPESIEKDVSGARLARFFTKDDHRYRVAPELRDAVVFAVQDVVADPPFSRLDLVFCRSRLIRLRPEARAKAISLFHFALREGGVLLLGAAEAIGPHDGRFEAIAQSQRLYRRIGHGRPQGLGVAIRGGEGPRDVRAGPDVPRAAEREQERATTGRETPGAARELEIRSEGRSKQELQSLIEELAALNGQLQETLERQRATANDLRNVLYSTGLATLFLDADLKIRLFTPAAKSLFSIAGGDIGRPLADLRSLASDGALLAEAGTVLRAQAPLEREIEGQNGARYLRRISPYRTQDDSVEGVVITFADITERAHAAAALETAKREAEFANAAKSRFLAAASHDLRQPLQTLALLQGLLAKSVEEERPQKLVARIDEALGAMSAMLNALFDINQIEAGAVHAEVVDFPIDDLLGRLRDEYSCHARAQGLELRVVPCAVSIRSDPRLLEQMIRNLLSNAMKYTSSGKVLLGCRRRGETLSVEVWDTGAGIRSEELQAIFEEYHQSGNVARERSRGFGLGLSIVQRLGGLLGHRIRVRSKPGRGSVFAIEARIARGQASQLATHRPGANGGGFENGRRAGVVLVVEDEPDLRDLLGLLLKDEGHHAVTASDGVAALALAAKGAIRPDLILADYNLPNGMDGLQLAAKLRQSVRRHVPVVILTGDISAAALREIAREDCVQLNKPVKAQELTQVVQRLLAAPAAPLRARPARTAGAPSPVIFVVDDDRPIRDAIRAVLEEDGWAVEDYATCEAFLEAYHPVREGCLLIDAYLPGMSGVELLQRLKDVGDGLPAIMITGNSDVPMAVQAMKAGALDLIEKPIGPSELVASVARALDQGRDTGKLSAWRDKAAQQLAELTSREREIMDLVLAGQASKNIAAQLGISQRTVENHRAAIMKKTGSASLPALARLAVTAAWKRAGLLK